MSRISQTVVLFFLVVLTPAQVFAQEVIVPQPSDLIISGNTVYRAATDEYELTQNSTWQMGKINTKKSICAKEYKISYDAFVGDKNANLNGGAGVIFYEINTKNYNVNTQGTEISSSLWMNIVELNVQDRARVSNYNFLELFSVNDPAPGLSSSRVPFSMSGAGYMHIEYHMNEGVATALLTHPLGVISVAAKRNFVPGTPVGQQFFAWTGVASNVQKIKNIKMEIIRPDDCAAQPSLSLEEARNAVVTACGSGDCPNYETFLSCATSTLETLRVAGALTTSNQNLILDEYQAKSIYCSGLNECRATADIEKQQTYNQGFTAGATSIDQEAIRVAAFSAGVGSIDVNAIKSTSFALGVASIDQTALQNAAFSKGVASVDVELIRLAGFNAGAASIDQNAIRKAGYDSGVASIDVEAIKQAARDAGFQAGMSSVDVAAIKAEAYQSGFGAGAASIDQTAIEALAYQHGYDSGVASVPQCASSKVTICHVAGGNGKKNTIEVAQSALKAHLKHGDSIGACPASSTAKTKNK